VRPIEFGEGYGKIAEGRADGYVTQSEAISHRPLAVADEPCQLHPNPARPRPSPRNLEQVETRQSDRKGPPEMHHGKGAKGEPG
jgi:hypothetical protein